MGAGRLINLRPFGRLTDRLTLWTDRGDLILLMVVVQVASDVGAAVLWLTRKHLIIIEIAAAADITRRLL